MPVLKVKKTIVTNLRKLEKIVLFLITKNAENYEYSRSKHQNCIFLPLPKELTLLQKIPDELCPKK